MKTIATKYKTPQDIINNLMLNDITNKKIINAILNVNMEFFVPNNLQSLAYTDCNIKYDDNKYLIDVFTLGHMLSVANFNNNQSAMVINAGNGYIAAVLSTLFNKVVNVEEKEDYINEAKEIYRNLNIKNVGFIKSNIKSITTKDKYNLIIVDGAVNNILNNWLDLLQNNGILIAVVNNNNLGKITLYTKITDNIIPYTYKHSPLPIIESLIDNNKFVF